MGRRTKRKFLSFLLIFSFLAPLIPTFEAPKAEAAAVLEIDEPYFEPSGTAENTQKLIIEVKNQELPHPYAEFTQRNDRDFDVNYGQGIERVAYVAASDDYPTIFRKPFVLPMAPYKPKDMYLDANNRFYPADQITGVIPRVGDAAYLSGRFTGHGDPIIPEDGQTLTVDVTVGGSPYDFNEPFENGGVVTSTGKMKRAVRYDINMDILWYGEIHQTKTLNASTADNTLTVGQTSNSTVTVTTTGYQPSGGPVDVNHNSSTTAWSSSNNGIASVNPSTGHITAIGPGTATITVRWRNQEYNNVVAGQDWDIKRSFTVTVTKGPPTGGGGGNEPPPPEADITGDFDILPSTINYRDSFSLKPKNITGTNGCTYLYHQFRVDGRGEMARVYGQNTTSTYSNGSYPWGIGVGSHQISMKVVGSCGASDWIGPKTLTILGPADNNPPFFKLGWFANGDWTSKTSVPTIVQGSTMMVRIIETPDSIPPSPSDPDGDDISITGWNFTNNAWTQSLPGKYQFHPQAEYLSGIVMDTPGYHTIRATMTDEFGAQFTASTMIQVIPPNPVPVITGPAQVKEGRPLPSPFSSAQSYSPIGRTIDHARDEWTNKEGIYTTPGTEVIRLHVYDDQGLKSLEPATHTLTVIPDQPPVAKLEIVPIGIRGQTYYVYNKSVSNDGDTITSVEYRMRYDANNNGFSDDDWTTLSGNMTRAAFTPNRVGKYQMYVKATEDYGKTDDTLSDPLSVTTIDIQNLSPEVSFTVEGKNEQPDLSPELVYTPSTIYGWSYSQVNSNAALPGKGTRWTVGSALRGGLGKKDERIMPVYTSYTYNGTTVQGTWFSPFPDNGLGANGLSPYRPIQTPNPAYTQPLLIPIDTTSGPVWSPITMGAAGSIEQYKTTRTHLYFTASTDGNSANFYAFNKSKMGRYQFEMTAQGSKHNLLDGSPYDYIIDKKTIQNSNLKFMGERRSEGSTQIVSFRKAGATEYVNTSFVRTVKAHATEKTMYQMNEWTCNSCYVQDGSYVPYTFFEVRTYDLATGALIKSSLESNVFYRDFYNIYGVFTKGDNLLFITQIWRQDTKNTFLIREFDRNGTLLSTKMIGQPADIYKSDSAWQYRCSGGFGGILQGLDGEWYRYEEFGCWGKGQYDTTYDYRTQWVDEVYVAKYNADATLAWRVKLAGRQSTPRESFSWKMLGGGFDSPQIVMNPFRNEILVKTHSYLNFDGASYIQAVDMTTGAIKPVDPALNFSGMTKNFIIDWNGNYVLKDPMYGLSLTVDNKWLGYTNDPDQGRALRLDGTVYSQYPTGGVMHASAYYATVTGRPWSHELIGDGMTITFLSSVSGGYENYSYVPWLNKGTPSTDPAVAPGFTLGQFFSPFVLGNHEINFTLSLEDEDYDRDLAGFSFRAQNGTNRYALETDGVTLFLCKYVNSARTVLQQTNYPFADKVPVNFKIKTLGSRIEVFVNGAPYFDVTDGSWTSGKIGPFSNKSYVQFGSITAKELKAPEIYWDSAYALWEAGSARAEVKYSNIVFSDIENDPVAGSYKWRYSHTPKFMNNQGYSAMNGQTFSSSQLYFDKVGVYDVTMSAEDDPHPSYRYPSGVFGSYRKASNEFARRITVHRRPIAQFTLSLNSDKTVGYLDTSYDPDRWASASSYSAPEDGKDYGATRGVFDRRYYYITPSGSYVESQLIRPSEYGEYRVGLAVLDEYGAWSEWAVRTIQIDNPFPPNTPPVAAMTYPAGTQASPTMETSRRPVLRWNQTDADPGTVFTRFQIQVTNEANTATVLNSGELAQNTSSASAAWTPTSDLPTGQKLRVRVRVHDGAEWSAWSAQTWLFINNAPTATLTYPTGTQASPTVSATQRPVIRWTQTDPDPGTVFEYFEVEISNEANNIMLADSGQFYQHTSSTNGSWTVDTDLPLGRKLRARVRVFDGFVWSSWSDIRWMIVNRPPAADFTWTPTVIYESDDVAITNTSTDPDGDALTYVWTITRPDGATETRTTTNVTLYDVVRGTYTIRLRATDPHGASGEVVRTFVAGDLAIEGKVVHTPEWEDYRLRWNEKFPDRQRSADTFWAGEAFVLQAETTDTGASATKPTSVTATLLEVGDAVRLDGGSGTSHRGTMVNPDYASTLSDGPYTMRFRVVYSNGHVETDDVPFRISGTMYDVIVNQQRL